MYIYVYTHIYIYKYTYSINKAARTRDGESFNRYIQLNPIQPNQPNHCQDAQERRAPFDGAFVFNELLISVRDVLENGIRKPPNEKNKKLVRLCGPQLNTKP